MYKPIAFAYIVVREASELGEAVTEICNVYDNELAAHNDALQSNVGGDWYYVVSREVRS